MKSHLKPLIALLAFALIATAGSAQSLKVGVVDMASLFDSHYKTAEKNIVFQEEQERVKAEIERLNGQGLALQEEAQGLAEQLNNPVLKDDAKALIEQDARTKVEEMQRKQQEMNALVQNSSESLKQRIMNFRTLLMDEISQVAQEVAKRQGITLLFDKSGPSLLGMPAVLYAEEGLEITAEVLAEINKDKPADAPDAPVAGPASSDSADTPTVSFPGN
ncbi:MAG: OmpH family outer membrane protein [Opitutaceae bacterium]|jgi:outer membrane protein|nr:OmpH family outer membrane protein [Opitutaceae bacterium]